MNEFLTDNRRKAYPLDGELPEGLGELWGQILLDACVCTSRELWEGQRLVLRSFQRLPGQNAIEMDFGDGFVGRLAHIGAGLGRNAVVSYGLGSGSPLVGIFTVDGDVVDAILADGSYGTDRVEINLPFALRCCSSGHRRVTDISVYSAPLCETPVFTSEEEPAKTISGGDVTIAAKDGIDLEVTGMLPLRGDLLRVSAIAAPAETSESDTEVDLMVRGDGCITVEAIPGAKVVGDTIQPRTASEPDGLGVMGGGVIKIGNSCRACCQCEDYKAVVDALRGPEDATFAVQRALDDAKKRYDEAVAAFEAAKEAARDAVNSYDNVRASAVAAVSSPGYGEVTAKGKRARIAATLYVENLTTKTATVSATGFAVDGFTYIGATWTHVGQSSRNSGTGLPTGIELAPGDTLTVSATYAKEGTTNDVGKPDGMTASYTARLPGQSEVTRSVPVL